MDEQENTITAVATMIDAEPIRAAIVEERIKSAKRVSGQLYGTVLEHGSAPYNFDKDQKESYYIAVERDGLNLILWGVDLEREASEKNIEVGQSVHVECVGKRPVDIEEKTRDKKTGEIKVTKKQGQRYTYAIEPWEPASAEIPASLQGREEVEPEAQVASNDEAYVEAQDEEEKPATETAQASSTRKPLSAYYDEAAVHAALARFEKTEDGPNVTLTTRMLMARISIHCNRDDQVLRTSSDMAIAADGVIAQAMVSGWNPIEISGSERFKSNCFIAACRMGAELSNYQPLPADLKALEKEQIQVPAWVTAGNTIKPAAKPASSSMSM